MQIYLDRNRTSIISYQFSVEALKALGGSPLPREDSKDSLQIRCLVNGTSNRFTSSFTSVYLVEDQYLFGLSSTFVISLPAGKTTISLQWKKLGKQVSKWVVAGPTYESGYSLSVMAEHDLIWHRHELNDVVISTPDSWKRLTGNLDFSLSVESNVIIGYSFAAQPQIGKFVKDSGLEYISSRVMVDGATYSIKSTVFGTSRWNPTTGILRDNVLLKLSAGNHTVHLEWKKIGYAFQNWLSTPSIYDGFASSRNIYVIVDKYQSKNVLSNIRTTNVGDEVWRIVPNQVISFDLIREAAVYITYGLPVTQYANPNLGNYSWDHLSGISTRILVDNVPYNYASTSDGLASGSVERTLTIPAQNMNCTGNCVIRSLPNNQSLYEYQKLSVDSALIHTCYGSLGLLLSEGTHTVAVQWRADQGVNWMTLNKVTDGFFQSSSLLIFSSMDSAKPEILFPVNATTSEDVNVSVPISIYDQDSLLVDDAIIFLSIDADIGSFLFLDVPILSNTSYVALSIFKHFEIYDSINLVNQILGSLIYVPASLWSGVDSLIVRVSDEGNLGYDGVKTCNATVIVRVLAVDNQFHLSTPDFVIVNHNEWTHVVNISFHDVDSMKSIFRVELMVSCGYISIMNSELSRNLSIIVGSGWSDEYLVYEGVYSDILASLNSLAYKSRAACDSFQHNDMLYVKVVNLDNLSLVKSSFTTIIIDYEEPLLSLETISYPRWQLNHLSVIGPDRETIDMRVYASSLDLSSYPSSSSVGLQSHSFASDKSSLVDIRLDNNALRYGFTLQFGEDRIDYASTNHLLPRDSWVAFTTTKALNHNVNISCRVGSEAVKGSFTGNNTVQCILPVCRFVNTTDSIDVLWINVVASENHTEVFSSQYLIFYVLPLPQIIALASGYAYRNIVSNIMLSVSNSAPVRYCLFNGSVVADAVLQNSVVICNVLMPNVSEMNVVLLDSLRSIISNNFTFDVLIVPRVQSVRSIYINSSSYFFIKLVDSQPYTSNHDAFCQIENFSVKASDSMGGYICLSPSTFDHSRNFLFHLQSVTLTIDTSLIEVPNPTFDSINISLSSARFEAGRNITTLRGYGFSSLLLHPIYCNYDNSLVHGIITSDNSLDCPGGDGIRFVSLVMDSNRSLTTSFPVTGYPKLTLIDPRFCFEAGCQISLFGSNLQGDNVKVAIGGNFVGCLSISSFEVKCIAPPSKPGPANISLYVDGFEAYAVQSLDTFDYLLYPKISSIAPTVLLVGESNVIELIGDGLLSSYLTALFMFTGLEPSPIVRSNASIVCPAPVVLHPSLISFTISLTYQNITVLKYNQLIRFIDDITISNMTPMIGDVFGNTTVILQGSNFFQSSSAFCRFGMFQVPGIVIDLTNIECITPAHQTLIVNSAAVPVSVILDGYEILSPIDFQYVHHATVTQVWWTSDDGGTIIVYGAGFRNTTNILCLLNDDIISQGIFASKSMIRCFASSFEGNVSVDIYQDGVRALANSTSNILEQCDALVLDVWPRVGYLGDTTDIHVTGKFCRNLTPGIRYHCILNESHVPALIQNESMAKCSLPSTLVAGIYQLTIADTANTPQNSTSGLFIRIVDPISIYSAFNYSFNKGSKIILHGNNFFQSSHIDCIIDGSLSSGKFVNSTILECLSTVDDMFTGGSKLVNVSVVFDGSISPSFLGKVSQGLTIARVSKLIGSVFGGSSILVEVSAEDKATSLECAFDGMRVQAEFLFGSQFQCVSPSLPEGIAKLAFYLDSQIAMNASGYPATYDYSVMQYPVANEISPSAGYLVGGTECVILLKQALDTSIFASPICRFGNISVSGAYLNASALQCASPPFSGQIVVQVIVYPDSSSHSLSEHFLFRYIEDIIVFSVFPYRIPMNESMTIIVTGQHFFPAQHIFCQFNSSISTPGKYLNSTAVTCSTPPITLGLVLDAVELRLTFDRYQSMNSLTLSIIPPVLVSSISPLQGPSYGGTTITIHGSTFEESADISCLFDLVQVSATYLSANVVECVSPSYAVGVVNLQVVQDGVRARDADTFQLEIFHYEYVPSAVVYSISPSVGSSSGGMVVQVTGEGFTSLASLSTSSCLIGTSVSQLYVINDTTSVCSTPPSFPGLSTLRIISTASAITIPGSARFRFIDDMVSIKVQPQVIGTVGSTNIIVISDSSFLLTDQVYCIVGSNFRVKARFLNQTSIECTVQDVDNPLGISHDEELFIAIDEYVLQSSVTLHFEPPPVIFSPSSFVSSTIGGSPISVAGQGFSANSSIVCLFDTISKPAIFLSSAKIACTSPTHHLASVSFTVKQNGLLAVTLGSNDSFIGEIHYFDTPFINDISPRVIHFQRSLKVKVFGERLNIYNSSVSCVFGDVVVAAFEVTSTYITCLSPSHDPGPVVVTLKTSSDEEIAGSQLFRYVDEILLAHLTPAFGSVFEETSIIVVGTSFYPARDIGCAFEGIGRVPGFLVNSSAIQCKTPKRPLQSSDTLTSVRILLDDIESSNAISYTYLRPLLLQEVYPITKYVFRGARIDIVVEDLSDRLDLICLFGGDLSVNADLLLPSGYFSCMVPYTLSDSVEVRIINNQINALYAETGLPFRRIYQIIESPVVESLSSNYVNAIDGRIYINGYGFGHFVEKSLRCRFQSLQEVSAVIINETLASCDLPPASTGNVKLRLFLQSRISNEFTIHVFSTNVSYTLSTRTIPSRKSSIVLFSSTQEWPPSLYRCGLSSSLIKQQAILLGNKIICNIHAEKIEYDDTIQLVLEGYGLVHESPVKIVNEPAIALAIYNVFHDRSYVGIYTSMNAVDALALWYCVFETFQVPIYAVNGVDNWLFCNVSGFTAPRSIYLQQADGILRSNELPIIYDPGFLQDILILDQISRFVESTISPFLPDNQTFQMRFSEYLPLYGDYNNHQVTPRRIADYIPTTDSSSIRRLLHRKPDVQSEAIDCYINNSFSCLQSRSSLIEQFVDVKDSYRIDSRTLPHQVFSVKPSSPTLFIESVQPNEISISNWTWVTVFGEIFRNSTLCYTSSISLTTVFISRNLLRCRFPGQYELHHQESIVYVSLRDAVTDATSYPYPLFYQGVTNGISYDSDLPSGAIGFYDTNPETYHGEVIVSSKGRHDYCSILERFLSFHDRKVLPTRRNKFIIDKLSQLIDLASNCRVVNMTKAEVDSTNAIAHNRTIDLDHAQNISSNFRLLSPINLSWNRTSGFTFHFFTSKDVSADDLCIKFGDKAPTPRCIVKDSSILTCLFPSSDVNPGSYTIYLLLGCQQITYSTKIQVSLAPSHLLPLENHEQIVIRDVKPLVGVWSQTHTIFVISDKLQFLSHCRFTFYDSDDSSINVVVTEGKSTMHHDLFCELDNIRRIGLAGLEISVDNQLSWIPTHFLIRFIPEPKLTEAQDYSAFNSTIVVEGSNIPSMVSIFCLIGLEGNRSIIIPGVRTDNYHIHCIGFDSSKSTFLLENVMVTFNSVDYYSMNLTRWVDLPKTYPSNSTTTRQSSHERPLISPVVIVTHASELCDESFELRVEAIPGAVMHKCQGIGHSTMVHDLDVYYSGNQVNCAIPSLPPGPYLITLQSRDSLGHQFLQAVNLTCLPHPKVFSAKLLPMSTYDGTSTFQLSGYGFNRHMNVRCVFSFESVTALIDSPSRMYCSFKSLVIDRCSKLQVSIRNITLYEQAGVCLTDEMISYGNNNLENRSSFNLPEVNLDSKVIVPNRITSTSANIGLTEGGLPLELVLPHLDLSAAYYCYFGMSSRVIAKVYDDSKVVCVIPPMKPGNVSLFVQNSNNRTWCCSWFFYFPRPVIFSQSPSFVTSTGRDVITILTTKFPFSQYLELYCYVGMYRSKASITISHNEADSIQCRLPGPLLIDSVDVSIGSVAERWPVSSTFAVLRSNAVTAYSPRYGSSTGGTKVSLSLSITLPSTANITCLFGNNPAPHSVYDTMANILICMSPPSRIGPSFIYVFDATFRDSPQVPVGYYFYEDRIQLLDVTPKLVLGLEDVDFTINGVNFRDTSELICLFDDITVTAKWISSSKIVCRYTPPNVAGIIHISVTNNGVDMVSGLSITVTGIKSIIKTSPLIGYSTSNTPIVISLISVVEDIGIQCKFGSILTTVVVVNSSSARCLSPQLPSGPVNFSILNNGVSVLEAVYESVHLPIVKASTTVILESMDYSFYVHGHSFHPRTLGYIQRNRACMYINSTALLCSVRPNQFLDEDSVYLDLSVNGGVDFYSNVLSFTKTKPLSVKLIYPSFLLSNGAVNIEILASDTETAVLPIMCHFLSVDVNLWYPANRLSGNKFVCRSPSDLLRVGAYVDLTLYQHNHLVYGPIALDVLASPIVTSISTSNILAGRFTTILVHFKDSFLPIGQTCIVGNTMFSLRKHLDNVASCLVQHNDPGRIPFQIAISTIFNTSLIYETILNVVYMPNDLMVNSSAILIRTPTIIRILSAACTLPSSLDIRCGSKASDIQIEPITSNDCFIDCRVTIFEALMTFDLGICFDSDVCSTYEQIAAVTVYSQSPILSISPHRGRVQGNTSVVVYGYDFEGVISCLFDSTLVLADIISSSKLICTSPPHGPGVVPLSLYRNNVLISSVSLTSFEYYPMLSTRLLTSTISSLGQSKVIVEFYSMEPIERYFECRFDEYIVPARLIDWSLLECYSPPMTGRDQIALNIRVDYEDFSDPLSLDVLEPPEVLYFEPQDVSANQAQYDFRLMINGPSFDDGLWQCTVNEKQGKVIFNIKDVICRIEDTISVGPHNLTFSFASAPLKEFLINANERSIIQRIYPTAGFNGESTMISIYVMPSYGDTSSFKRCCFDGGVTSPAIRLSSNVVSCYITPSLSSSPINSNIRTRVGLISTDSMCIYSDFEFSAVNFPHVLSVSRSQGYVTGGDYIELFLSEEYLSNNIYCKIGEGSYLGQVYGRSSLLCLTRKSIPGRYLIELSANGIDFYSTEFFFEYLDIQPLSSALPIPSLLPEIKKIEPTILNSEQIQTIRVYGDNFIFGAACLIGPQRSMLSTVISSTEMVCQSVIHAPGSDTLVVRNPQGNVSSEVILNFQVGASLYISHGNSVNPPFGPLRRNTLITVFGNNLDKISSQVLCVIGSEWVYAFDVKANSLSCIAPTSSINGRVSVRVGNLERDLIPGYGSFEYIDDPIVYKVIPSRGAGNSQVLLIGRGFERMPSLGCLFDNVESPASVLSDTEILCIAPVGLQNGSFLLSLSTNGQYVLRTGLSFEYLLLPSITYIWPSQGPALRGNTIVTLTGSNFPNSIDLYCVFGTTRVIATTLTPKLLQCRTPSHLPGKVNVTVFSASASLMSTTSVEYNFTPDVSIYRVHPASGPKIGGYPVFILGNNFINSTSLGCMFGDMQSRAMFLNPNTVLCLAPSPIGRPIFQYDDYSVSVEVTNNGYDYSNSNISFYYYQSCEDGSFCMGSTSHLCPNGTYCERNANNFTLCAPGFFQPLQGQTSCVLCSIGFNCPDSGMSRPVVCGNGQICDSFGLRLSTKSCPNGFYCLNGTKASSTEEYLSANSLYDVPNVWLSNQVTGAVYFNASSLDYSFKSWPFPASGQSRVIHPPTALCDGYDCEPGSNNFLAEAPFPCPIGYYCRTGVGTQISIPKNFSTPQRCFDGYFCGRGSTSPEGSGPCPNGYFCPTPVDAIPCLVGHYCPGVGNTAPIECYPGTYNPYEGRANCTVCDSGFICPGWGLLLPEPCPAGFVCMQLGLSFPVVLCPQGW
jgi:hypothetical protein